MSATYNYNISGQAKIDAVFPVTGSTIATYMDPINFDFYRGDDNYDYMQHVKGILDMWGAVYVPPDYQTHPKDFFSDLTYKVPVIAFHGELDNTFNYISQLETFSPNAGGHSYFNHTSLCIVSGTYTLEGNNETADLVCLGSKGFYDSVLVPLGINSELYLDCQMHHGLQADCDFVNDPGCYESEFGTGLNTKAKVYKYIAQRAAVFFQGILSSSLYKRTQKVFIECENKRRKCDYDPANSCTNTCP